MLSSDFIFHSGTELVSNNYTPLYKDWFRDKSKLVFLLIKK